MCGLTNELWHNNAQDRIEVTLNIGTATEYGVEPYTNECLVEEKYFFFLGYFFVLYFFFCL